MKVDYLIRNGRVIDPANGVDEVKDIAILGGRIVDTEGEAAETDPMSGIVDASGCIVTPGLIDFHVHLNFNGSGSIRPSMFAADGVTGVVDQGTAGTTNFEALMGNLIAHEPMRVKAYLAPHPMGQCGMSYQPNSDPASYEMENMTRLVEKYRDRCILGLKMQDSIGMVDPEKADAQLDALVELAEGFGIGVCVHTTNPPTPAAHIVSALRAGDIYCHCYQGKGDTILDENGRVKPEFIKARERGVLFDSANGINNFGIKVGQSAIEQGFPPDIISTDAIPRAYGKPYFYKNMPLVMSKMMAMGMSLTDVIRAATWTPARAMKADDEVGSLEAGKIADIAIFREKERKVIFRDVVGGEMSADRLLIPQMTFIAGEIRYCQSDFYLEF